MSDEIIIGAAYTPAEAERGKFAVINPTTLESLGYPTSGSRYGRYALLTYNINEAAGGGEGGGTFTGTVSTTELLSNTMWVGSSSVPAGSVYNVTTPQSLRELDIQNRTNESIYLLPMSDETNAATISSQGIEVFSFTLFSTKKEISQFSIYAPASGTIVVLGYYRA